MLANKRFAPFIIVPLLLQIRLSSSCWPTQTGSGCCSAPRPGSCGNLPPCSPGSMSASHLSSYSHVAPPPPHHGSGDYGHIGHGDGYGHQGEYGYNSDGYEAGGYQSQEYSGYGEKPTPKIGGYRPMPPPPSSYHSGGDYSSGYPSYQLPSPPPSYHAGGDYSGTSNGYPSYQLPSPQPPLYPPPSAPSYPIAPPSNAYLIAPPPPSPSYPQLYSTPYNGQHLGSSSATMPIPLSSYSNSASTYGPYPASPFPTGSYQYGGGGQYSEMLPGGFPGSNYGYDNSGSALPPAIAPPFPSYPQSSNGESYPPNGPFLMALTSPPGGYKQTKKILLVEKAKEKAKATVKSAASASAKDKRTRK